MYVRVSVYMYDVMVIFAMLLSVLSYLEGYITHH